MTEEQVLINHIQEYLDSGMWQYEACYLNRSDLKVIIKALEQDSVLDKIKGYIDHIRNTGMGKEKSLEFIEKFIEGVKTKSEDKCIICANNGMIDDECAYCTNHNLFKAES